ncbi:class F sortase [Cellulomonas sp. SG140]|uniref:class F sortase n=1 Tax=Cellulomonas sp. SG140 TaxID=2976536 RepID=UPI0021E791FE|nr:class F sortase [Cellulomonas sp. SG140]
MSSVPAFHGRRGPIAAAAVGLTLAGVLTLVVGLHGHAGPPAPPLSRVAATSVPVPTDAATDPPARPSPSTTAAPVPEPDLGPILPASLPVTLDIPSIGVHTTNLVPLSVGADGVLPPPTDYATAGYYTGGPTPGQLGAAVIAAHVDGKSGPAVFYRLGELTPGALVHVTRQDGTVATFTIDQVARYPKAQFPTQLVYGSATSRAEIRLITCGGAYDRTTGHYVDNVIAFGHLDP